MPEQPLVPFSRFVTFLAAPPAARGSVALSLARQSGYDVRRDFYGRLRRAIVRDRQSTRDGAAVRSVVSEATVARRRRFRELELAYLRAAPRWASHLSTRLPRHVVDLGPLSVAVSPTFAEQAPDGRIEAIYVRLSQGRLPSGLAEGAARLIALAYPEHVGVFVDLSGGTCVASTPRLRRLDDWLVSEAAGLAHLISGAVSS